MITLYRRMGS